MQVQRPPQVSPYLREKTRKTSSQDPEDSEVDEHLAHASMFERFLTQQRRGSVSNDHQGFGRRGRRGLLSGSVLYQLADESTRRPSFENHEPHYRFYRTIHERNVALALAGVDAHHFDV